MSRDQSRRVRAGIDDPDGSDRGRTTVGTPDWAVNSIFDAILRFGCGRDGVRSRVFDKCTRQNFPVVSGESESGEKLRLAGSFRVIECQEIISYLPPLDGGPKRIWKIHRFLVSL